MIAATTALAQAQLSVEEIAAGIFVHAGEHALMSRRNEGGIANFGFVIGDEAVAVVDTGGSVAVGEALLAAIRETTALPIRYVVNTHMHPDHIFGNAAFAAAGADRTAPIFVGHAKLPAALAARGQHYLQANRELMGEELVGKVEIVPPDLTVTGEATLDLGGRRLVARAWPTAHTDNDLTVFDTRTGTLFAGDLVFMEHLPVVDGSIMGWLEVQGSLAELPARRVVPGHGPASAEWPEALEAQRDYLQALADDLRRSIASGRGMADAVAQAAPPPGGWALVEEFHRRNATAAYAELEWE